MGLVTSSSSASATTAPSVSSVPVGGIVAGDDEKYEDVTWVFGVYENPLINKQVIVRQLLFCCKHYINYHGNNYVV